MKTSYVNLLVVALSIVFLVVAFPAAAQEATVSSEVSQESTPPELSPQSGSGRVFVLNDGTLILQWGDFVGNEGERTFEASLSLGIAVDTAELELVRAGNGAFLDVGQAELAKRNLAEQEVTRQALDAHNEAGSCERQAVMKIEGVVTLEQTRETDVWTLNVVDPLEGDAFSTTLRVNTWQRETTITEINASEGNGRPDCVADCKNGYCEVNNCRFDICICGIFGEAICGCLDLFGSASLVQTID